MEIEEKTTQEAEATISDAETEVKGADPVPSVMPAGDVTQTEEETAANLAAAKLQEQKKKKKALRRMILILLVVGAAVTAFGVYRYRQYKTEQEAEKANVLALSDGEELIYGRITSAIGNDIEIDVLQEADADSSESAQPSQSGEDMSSAPGGDSMPQGGGDMSSAPGGDSMPQGGGDMPSAPSGDSMPQGGSDMPSAPGGDSMPQGGSDMPSAPSGSGMPGGTGSYTDTGETKSLEVPVGTEVTTSLGAVTTFSKLSVGDVIGIVVQSGTDNILRIKIVE